MRKKTRWPILLMALLLTLVGSQGDNPAFILKAQAAGEEAALSFNVSTMEAQVPKLALAKYTPPRNLSIEGTIEAYFEEQYDSYVHNSYTDLSSILDTSHKSIHNMLRWWRILLQRRRLISENRLGYVETQKFSYRIDYEKTAEDNRMQLWKGYLAETGYTVVHFRVKGARGKAYPPIMAINSQHSMFLKKIDGQWKIAMHYFPGSARKFPASGTVSVPSEEAMLKQLKKEFALAVTAPAKIPANATIYDPEKAARYAKKYTETKNPDFYRIGDWVGNCQNFVSQCVWAGLNDDNALNQYSSKHMDKTWNGGKSGTAAWAHVNTFWNYTTNGAGGLYGKQITSASVLSNGDIIQTRQLTSVSEKGRFTHTLIVADENKMILAQNTPAGYVYYSDLANVEVRFVRPVYTLS